VVEVVGRAPAARPTEHAVGFAAALAEFEQGRFADAARGFNTILAAQTLDGPLRSTESIVCNT
jgi:hypothetical protein